ncbi:signal recognition particle 14 kDa protein-like isoform X2 [Quercus robur]|uniref:signal recognition particle 14 kDa protein-like isoform X2 n=1 Tax=Quercus robur TaxID=38942 RepID=UPI002163BBAC|nr:signal recognition particle 14 kDa protein-like isoform X2 [Quercus robur]
MVLLQLDPFLNELTSMFEHSTEKGSVWVTLKRSSLKSKVQKNKMTTAGDLIEYRCLIRATDGKKTISTSMVFLRKALRVHWGPFLCNYPQASSFSLASIIALEI